MSAAYCSCKIVGSLFSDLFTRFLTTSIFSIPFTVQCACTLYISIKCPLTLLSLSFVSPNVVNLISNDIFLRDKGIFVALSCTFSIAFTFLYIFCSAEIHYFTLISTVSWAKPLSIDILHPTFSVTSLSHKLYLLCRVNGSRNVHLHKTCTKDKSDDT
ncbi:hypothetical protein BpHYR1_030247 [Brachionus plicatilis]|uniref:Uncharacterized protein n=1 Tax=Brachionus plicatilis TaxID=10195 RepID=A0A3M7RYA4_BRAPC|nr:hypothetical protein BpHYR1_030247 [Brachionus plicatilis]